MIELRRLVALVSLLVMAMCVACRTSPDAAALDASASASMAIDTPDSGGTSNAGPRACAASASTCAANEYCAFTPRLCGKGKRAGACVAKPAACHDPYAPVCACDKKVYPTECDAHAAGVDLDVTGGCKEVVRDWIACGPSFCDVRTSYCEIVLSDVFELPSDYTCRPLPASCLAKAPAARTCDCFPAGTPCGSFCGPIANEGMSGFHLTCRK